MSVFLMKFLTSLVKTIIWKWSVCVFYRLFPFFANKMRYFFLIIWFFITGLIATIHTNPIYDLTVMRSSVSMDNDWKFNIVNTKPQNIWYISMANFTENSDNLCVEWDFWTEKKQECIDHDGSIGSEIFTFPVLSNAVSQASFHILGKHNIDPSDITAYSMDTRPSGSHFVFALPSIMAENGVISRREWWADETMRYTDSIYWKAKWPAYLKYVRDPKTQDQLNSIILEDDRLAFIRKNFEQNTVATTSLVRTENGHQLVWPIQKVKQISRIVLHHTAESMDSGKNDMDMIRGIYVYHTLSREWGDIWYNYLIWQRWQIYEWRAGGDYVVAAHAAYNNMWTVGISVLGDYNKNHLNRDQIAGIKQAVSMMSIKYGITLSDNKKWARKCITSWCYPLELLTTKSLLWHQDVGYTDCPGSGIYIYIPDFLSELNHQYSPVLNPITGTIEPLPVDQVMNRTLKTGSINPTVTNTVLPMMRPPVLKVNIPIPIRYIWPKFRVKLSYPDTENIILATADGKIGNMILDKKKIPMQVSQKISIGVAPNNKLTLKVWEKLYTGIEFKLSHTVVRIDSWDRVPDWDKSNRYNDNLFRDTIRVINQNGKLVVINDLPVEWYLKWLGEVSDSDLSEKIKTIIVSARSYARYYMDTRNRKFATHLYDGSDNPDEFQKYLGYSYEMRSPNVAKLVDATRNQVITYSGSIIKAWYHSSSDGRTLSTLEYCQQNRNTNCVDIPYLQSVTDPGSVWHIRSGHGVGISGIWATYFASQNWDYKKIIQYYMKWVEIQRK